MLTPKNNAAFTRSTVLDKVAASFIKDRFAGINDVIAEINPCSSCTKHMQFINDINKFRCMAALGFCPEDETDSSKSLHDYALEA